MGRPKKTLSITPSGKVRSKNDEEELPSEEDSEDKVSKRGIPDKDIVLNWEDQLKGTMGECKKKPKTMTIEGFAKIDFLRKAEGDQVKFYIDGVMYIIFCASYMCRYLLFKNGNSTPSERFSGLKGIEEWAEKTLMPRK